MTVNVYPADSGSMKRFLCRFAPEGNCLLSRDITEQAGGNVSLWELSVDGQGRLYLFLDNGEMLIAAVSEHKESAWSFIEESLTQEKGELYAELWLTYPALKRKLDERAEAALEREELNREDLDMVLSLLPNAMPLFSAEGDEAIKIINEEAPAYYSGQKGADDVVSVIQNRVQLYVNENR